MIRRVLRAFAAETLKIVSHPFLYLSAALLVALIPLCAVLGPTLSGREETAWRSYHALQIFAYGAKPGLKVATFIILIFTSMLLAGEFDRGTIKLLLTRPVTRTEFFLAKCATAVLLAAFFTGLTFYVGLAFGLWRGELGPVWDDQVYLMSGTFGEIVAHARKAVLLALLPTLAAAFLGLLVSSLTESSGYAVAAGLVLYIFLDLVVGFLRPGTAVYFFNFYPDYALEGLRRLSEGFSFRWLDQESGSAAHVAVPLASSVLFAVLAYLRFRTRDITA